MEKLFIQENGSFKLNSDGNIVNANGYPLSPEIVVPKCHYSYYSKDGIVTALGSTNRYNIRIRSDYNCWFYKSSWD